MAYIGAEPIVSATRTVTEVTATAGQTVFTANGGYTVGFLDVFINGSKLTSADFTATDGSTVTLTEAAQVSDIVRLEALGTFQAANAVLLTGNSNLTGNLNVSGNLGVGTTNPSYKLDVGSTSDATTFVNIKASTTGTSGVFFSDTNNGQGGIRYSHASDFMRFDTNDAERMRIDSSGRVTMPSQPAFHVRVNNSSYLTTSPVPFSNSVFDVGSNFNTSTYRFTAPISGKYYLVLNMYLRTDNNTDAYPRFRVNGTNVQYAYLYNNNTGGRIDAVLPLNRIFNLSAGDYVDVIFQYSGSGTYYGGNEETNFYGWLIA